MTSVTQRLCIWKLPQLQCFWLFHWGWRWFSPTSCFSFLSILLLLLPLYLWRWCLAQEMVSVMLVSASKDERYHLRRWRWCVSDKRPPCCAVIHHCLTPSSQQALPRQRCAVTDGLQQCGWRGYSVDVVPRSRIRPAPSRRFLLNPLARRARRRPLWERCESCGSASAINHLTSAEWATPLSLLKLARCRMMKNWEVWRLL